MHLIFLRFPWLYFWLLLCKHYGMGKQKPLYLSINCTYCAIEVILSSTWGHQTLSVTWLNAGWTFIQASCVWTVLSLQSWASQAWPKPHWNRRHYPDLSPNVHPVAKVIWPPCSAELGLLQTVLMLVDLTMTVWMQFAYIRDNLWCETEHSISEIVWSLIAYILKAVRGSR